MTSVVIPGEMPSLSENAVVCCIRVQICGIVSFIIVVYLVMVKLKAKFTLEQVTKAQRVVEVYLYSFFNLGAIWDGW
jgi:hypothetical protein